MEFVAYITIVMNFRNVMLDIHTRNIEEYFLKGSAIRWKMI